MPRASLSLSLRCCVSVCEAVELFLLRLLRLRLSAVGRCGYARRAEAAPCQKLQLVTAAGMRVESLEARVYLAWITNKKRYEIERFYLFAIRLI